MSSGKEAARDLRRGRRGGGWVPDGATPVVYDVLCEACRQPMVAGQGTRHAGCTPPAVADEAPPELFA